MKLQVCSFCNEDTKTSLYPSSYKQLLDLESWSYGILSMHINKRSNTCDINSDIPVMVLHPKPEGSEGSSVRAESGASSLFNRFNQQLGCWAEAAVVFVTAIRTWTENTSLMVRA